jgi:hypothetical protein
MTPKEAVFYNNSIGIGSGISYSHIQAGNAVAYGSIYAIPKVFFSTPGKFDFTTGVEGSAFISAFAFEVTQRWSGKKFDILLAPKIGTAPIGLIPFYYSFPYAITKSGLDSRKNTFELNVNLDIKSWNTMFKKPS